MDPDNDYSLTITNGSNWEFLNRAGIQWESTSDVVDFGAYAGDAGLDIQGSYNYLRRSQDNDSYWRTINYADTSTPTAYPLSIRVYRAQAPQDTDFAIIQFTQTINGIIQPYGTFNIAKGSQHGAGVYDLDYVFQDAVTEIYSNNERGITFTYDGCGKYYYGSAREPVSSNTKARAASYGYLRNGSSYTSNPQLITTFESNIDTSGTGTNEVSTYYRNSTYDAWDGKSVSASANYYKPIKGIPICNQVLPVPYYLPDDFVLLQVATTPGLVAFRTGDTVTISGSEVYEIIYASHQSQQNGLDDVDNNSTIGMLFMARTT